MPLDEIHRIVNSNQNCVREKSEAGWLPLHWACNNLAPVKVVELLVAEYPLSVMVTDDVFVWLPLHWACANQASLEVVQLLVEKYSDSVMIKDPNGCLPLHLACAWEAPLNLVVLLVAAWPASVMEKNNDGLTALGVAIEEKATNEVVQYLHEQYEDVTYLHNEYVKLVAEWPDSVMDMTDDGLAALDVAREEDEPNEIVQYLQEQYIKSCSSSSSSSSSMDLLQFNDDSEGIGSDFDVSQPSNSSNQESNDAIPTSSLETITHEDLLQMVNEAKEDRELWMDVLISLQQQQQQQPVNQSSDSVLLTEEEKKLLTLLLGERSMAKEEEIERLAILNSKIYSEFYVLLVRKLNSMIGACENLSSNMVAEGSSVSIRSIVLRMFKDKRIIGDGVVKTMNIGEHIAKFIEVAKRNVPLPFSDGIGSFLQMILQMKAMREQCLGVANVADFATLASLKTNGLHGTFRCEVERFARVMVRALFNKCILYNNKAFEDSDKDFGAIKKYMLKLLAEPNNVPSKERGSDVANCALAHIMKPGEGTPLFLMLVLQENEKDDIKLYEALAATTLNMTIEQVRDLPKFELSKELHSTIGNGPVAQSQDTTKHGSNDGNNASTGKVLATEPSIVEALAKTVEALEELRASHAALKASHAAQEKKLSDTHAAQVKNEQNTKALKKKIDCMNQNVSSEGGLIFAEHHEANKNNEVTDHSQEIKELRHQVSQLSEHSSTSSEHIDTLRNQVDCITMRNTPKRQWKLLGRIRKKN